MLLSNVLKKVTINTLSEKVGNPVFHVEFIKKSDGSLRKMACQLHVKHGLVGGKSTVSEKEDLLSVFDVAKGEYRVINLTGLKMLEIGGNRYEFE